VIVRCNEIWSIFLVPDWLRHWLNKSSIWTTLAMDWVAIDSQRSNLPTVPTKTCFFNTSRNHFCCTNVWGLGITHYSQACLFVYYLQFYALFGTRESIKRKVSWRTNCILVLAASQKLGQGDRVCSLHELSKSACVGDEQGRTKSFPNFLCIWTDKEEVLFILYLLQVVASTKPFSIWHALPCT
jgi:hypothetical protein